MATPPSSPTATPPSGLDVCDGVDPAKCPQSCPPGLMCNGTECVSQQECPCVLPSGEYLPVSRQLQ